MRSKKGRFLSNTIASRKAVISDVNVVEPVFQSWLHGRRVVELSIIIDKLKACASCGSAYSLDGIVGETLYGLASILHITCDKCNTVNLVPTGKRHAAMHGSEARRCFDVNTKLAAAMVNAGVGESQISAIIAELNLPGISKTTLKAREREIGPSIERVAETSCNNAIQQEINLITALNNIFIMIANHFLIQANPSGDHVETDVSTDGAWQKRGSNSLSGHVTVIGKQSKKCLGFSVAKKTCRTCKCAKRRKIKAKRHSCRKNWNGSSKAMEPFLTATCLQKVKQKGLDIERLTMDGDTTTFTRVKRSLFPDLKRSNDKNHIVKNLGNALYKIKSGHKTLTSASISHLQKCFSYALSQNKNNPQGIKTNLSALASHMFNEHSLCSPSWCKSLVKEEYTQAHILQEAELRKDLENIMQGYITECSLDMLARVQSTNANENLNHMIARKAPKTVTYSESESLDFRVSAAVAQKNEGRQYVVQVNETHGLSPGCFTSRKYSTQDARRAELSEKQQLVTNKKRRIELKADRLSKNFIDEVYEGKTYATAVGIPDLQDEDIVEIPPPPANHDEHSQPSYKQEDVIVFDLETTGLGTSSSILQIAALHVSTGQRYNTFVTPRCGYIPAISSNITGLSYHGGKLFHNCQEVASLGTKSALTNFKTWLKSFDRNVLLVAHNAMFDARMLVAKFLEEEVTVPEYIGFSDSLRLFKNVYPGRQTYKLISLVKDLSGVEFDAHDASEDVNALASILRLDENFNQLNRNSISVSSVKNKLRELANEKLYKDSYKTVVESKAMAKAQATRLARSGLSLKDLQTVHRRNGIDGLQAVLKDRGAGKSSSKLGSVLADVFDAHTNKM